MAADDQRLVELSTEPAGELFTILKQPNAFWPLLVLLAVLPGLYALEYRAMDAAGALWGLRGLNVYSADELTDILDPGGVTEASRLQWRSPLGSWLTALVAHLWNSAEPLTLVAASYLATAGVVALSYAFGDWLAGPRCGFWATVMLAFHGTLLSQAQTPAPHSLAILFAALAFWGYVRHVDATFRPFSRHLLLGGVMLGACLLTSGPLAVAVLAVLGLYAVGVRGDRVRPRRGPGRDPQRVWVGWAAFQSLLVLAAVALIVAGWWPALMAARHGARFWGGWLLKRSAAIDSEPVRGFAFPVELARGSLETLGPLIGLFALGLWLAGRSVVQNQDEAQRRRHLFVTAWVLCAAVVWISLLREAASASSRLLWQGFLLVPCVLLAALAAEAIAQRRVSVLAAIAVACFTVTTMLWSSLVAVFEQLDAATARSIAAVSILAVALATAWLVQHCRGRDFQQRLVLGTLLAALFVGNAVSGLASVRRAGDDERALDNLREELVRVENVGSWLIVSDRPVSLPLRLVLRSIWPDASRRIVETWDAALARALTDPPSRDERLIVIDWTTRDTQPTRIQIRELRVERLTRPRFLQNRQLVAYELLASGETEEP